MIVMWLNMSSSMSTNSDDKNATSTSSLCVSYIPAWVGRRKHWLTSRPAWLALSPTTMSMAENTADIVKSALRGALAFS